MAGESEKSKRLVGLFLLGAVLFNYPILAIFNLNIVLWGIPLLYVYLFTVWMAIIVMIGFVTRIRSTASPREDYNPSEDY